MIALRGSVLNVWLPAAIYLAIFLGLNPNSVGQFGTHFLFSGPDGFQNVWNLWWVKRSAAALSLPWWTDVLHHPYGTTLLGHTLNPFNGAMAVVLLEIFSIVETYNLIVIFSFVAGGVTAFWLCRDMTGSWLGSLVGGAVFTFSPFHVSHTSSHLQLVALEWIPLFLLLWIRFCAAPKVGSGIAAAIVLWLVALCDLYYVAYCVVAGALFYGWTAWQQRDPLFLFRGSSLRAAVAFSIAACLTSGWLAAALIVQNARSPFIGTHSPFDLGMDLLSPFVWSESSRYRNVVTLWKSLSPSPLEASVYVGVSVIALAIYTLTRRVRPPIAHLGFWLATAGFFFVMSLGPNLHIAGNEISFGLRGTVFGQPDVNFLVLPYGVVWLLFPPWRLAGVPLRMMVIVQLVAAIITAGGLRAVLESTWRWRRVAVGAFIAVLTLDLVPMPLGTMPNEVPAYVRELRRLPDGAVLDLASGAGQALFFQTVHEKPIAFGYISRIPRSVYELDQALVRLILAGHWEQIARDYRLTYVVKGARAAEMLVQHLNSAPLPEIDSSKRIYEDAEVSIYKF